MQEESGCLIVAVRTGRHLDAALDEAVDVLWPKAMTQQVGNSVTRLAPGRHKVPPEQRRSYGCHHRDVKKADCQSVSLVRYCECQ